MIGVEIQCIYSYLRLLCWHIVRSVINYLYTIKQDVPISFQYSKTSQTLYSYLVEIKLAVIAVYLLLVHLDVYKMVKKLCVF